MSKSLYQQFQNINYIKSYNPDSTAKLQFYIYKHDFASRVLQRCLFVCVLICTVVVLHCFVMCVRVGFALCECFGNMYTVL
jgi:phage-related protein